MWEFTPKEKTGIAEEFLLGMSVEALAVKHGAEREAIEKFIREFTVLRDRYPEKKG